MKRLAAGNIQKELERLKQTIISVDFFKRMLMGLVIGIAFVTPGLSGAVIAAAAGLYEPAVHAVVSIKKEFRKSVQYLLPLAVGGGVGTLLFSRVMQELMIKAQFGVLYIFLGLVTGSIPFLVKEANDGGFRAKYLWAAAIALAAVIYTGQMTVWAPYRTGNMELSAVNTMICGAVVAVGTIIPGISSSFMLMYLGAYEGLLAAITSFDIKILVLLGIGSVVTGLLIIRLVEVLFRRFHGFAYYTVIGFLLGSMVMVFPGLRNGGALAVDISLFLVSAAASFAMMRLNQKRQ